jgi:hypothetical protein
MRTPNLGSVTYIPQNPPEDPARLQGFLRDELQRIRFAIEALAAGHLDVQTSLPAKPRRGDMRYFDGVNAQPNGTGGEGIWYYNGTVWVQLG